MRRAVPGGFRLRRAHEEESGAIAIMAAVLAAALVLSASLAVDVGRVAATSRDLQGAADRAALDGVKELRDAYRQHGTVDATTFDAVVAEVTRSLEANGYPGVDLTDLDVRLGYVEADEVVFHEVMPDPSPEGAGKEPNAVQVHAGTFQDYVLALGVPEGGRDIPKTAVAASDAVAAISAGTTTASVSQDVGLANDLLGVLLGDAAAVGLDVVGYEGMANTLVELPLLAAELGLGSVQELLDAELTVRDLFGGMIAAVEASALEGDGDAVAAAVAALETLEHADGVGSLPHVTLGEILDVDTGGSAGADAGVDAFNLVMGSLLLANATGDEDADCAGPSGNALVLDLDAPGVGEVCLNIIEPPVIAVGPARTDADGNWRTVARTAQTRLDVELLTDGLLDLELLGFSAEALNEPLPLSVRTGEGSAALVGTQCVGDGRIDTLAQVGTATLDLPETMLFQLDVSDPLLGLSLLTADVGVAIDGATVGGGSETFVFPGPDYPSDAQRLHADEAGLTAAVTDALEVISEVSVGSLELDAGDLLDALVAELAPLLQAVEDETVGPLVDLLGVELGSVDVRALDLECDGRRLLPLDTDA